LLGVDVMFLLRPAHDICHACAVTPKRPAVITKRRAMTAEQGRAMALTPLDTEGAAPLQGPEADVWRTLAAWLWTTYLALVTGAIFWWVF
jgi:hypothetical protein